MLIAALFAESSAQNVVSRPVGFLRVAVPSNSNVLVSAPFHSLTAAAAGDTNAAGADRILTWDGENQEYVSNAVPAPGEGFWLKAGAQAQNVFLFGEVVLEDTNTVVLQPALNLVGYPYAAEVALGETELWRLKESTPGDEILDAESATVASNASTLGTGFWYVRNAEECLVWTEVRPYANVFPTNNDPPEIVGLEVVGGGTGVTLTVRCSGQPGETLDVLYQAAPLAATGMWSIAATALPASGVGALEWTDFGSGERSPVNDVAGRYYLVGRADIDSDSDGVPDAQEEFVYGGAWAGTGTDGAEEAGGEGDWASEAGDEDGLEGSEVGEGETNGVVSPRVLGRVIYVDRQSGNDAYSGRVSTVEQGDGPKGTIAGGMDAVTEAGALVIHEGDYGEDLNLAGRDIEVVIRGHVNLAGSRGAPRVRTRPSGVSTNR